MIEQKNIDSPFTEIFALLKRQALVVHGKCEPDHHESDIIIAMQSHVDNAIEVLLDGLQDLGMLMVSVVTDKIPPIVTIKDPPKSSKTACRTASIFG